MNLKSTILRICIFIALAAVIYDKLTKRIPSRLRMEEAPQSASGIVRADTFSSPSKHTRAQGIDIIFVHGLGSNPDTTWGPTGRNWVSDFLPQDIPAASHRELRIFFYNFDSYWKRDAVQTRLWRLGRSLLDSLCSQIRSTEEERRRTIIFVGYSYGGLVIKQALVLASRDQAFKHVIEHALGVIFLGTPHRGSSFSAWGSVAARALRPLGSNSLLVEEVAYDAFPLLELHEEFENAISNKVQTVNFFEQRKTLLLKAWFFQWEEFCVREQSATYSRVENVGLPVDHYGLNKFVSKDDENYKSILRRLLRLMEPIAAHKQQRLYSVPVNTVETYTERQKLSAAIAEGLRVRNNEANVPHALVIYGLGGTGKTQLALKYVEDHKDDYSPILWIDAKDKESLLSSYERCASELQLQVSPRQARNTNLVHSLTVQAVRRWLEGRQETDEPWLVVIDNADDFSFGIQRVLPKGSRGSIIITSQDRQAQKLVFGGCEAVRVDTMERLEARTLILQHLKLDHDSVTEEVVKECDEVTEQLGCLALAVDLAGAYISDGADRKQELQRYLQRYVRHKDSLLRNEDFRGLLPSEKTIWTVWDTTMERIEALEKLEGSSSDLPARLLFPFLARFGGKVVQDELFRLAAPGISKVHDRLYAGAVELPSWLSKAFTADTEEWDDYCYERTQNRLVRYSLLQRSWGKWPGVMMHGLVQWRAMKYEEEEPWEKWHFITIMSACEQLAWRPAVPHFRRELIAYIPTLDKSYLEDLGIDDKGKATTWHMMSMMFIGEGRWKEAEEMLVQALETRRRLFGEEHPDTLSSMANLASTYSEQGRWKEAEELELQTLESRKRLLGEEHTETLTSGNNLAITHNSQGQWGKAEQLIVQVIAARKRVLGKMHPDTLMSMNSLALTYIGQRRWGDAEELLEQVTETRKKVLGKVHPDTLISMSNLATTYVYQGRWKEAEKLFMLAIEISEVVLGEEHHDTLISTGNLAFLYRSRGQWKKAEELEVHIIEIRRRVFGKDHPNTLISMVNLALTLRGQGRNAEAVSLLDTCIEIGMQAFGPQHPSVLSSFKIIYELRPKNV